MKSNENTNNPVYNRSVERAMQILCSFDSEKQDLSMVQLSKSLNLPKATVHRLCQTLTKYNFLVFNEKTKRYSLGIKLFELGSIIFSSFSIRKIASPHLDALLEPGKTVHLCIMQDGQTLYIDQRNSNSDELQYIPAIGKKRPPYYGAHGQILMAYLPEEEIERLLKEFPLTALTKKSIIDNDEFKKRLSQIRDQGYAVDIDETIVGFTTIGAPIRNLEEEVVAVVIIGFMSASENSKGLQRIIKKTVKIANDISKGMGYRLH